jgi:hypothetical protein
MNINISIGLDNSTLTFLKNYLGNIGQKLDEIIIKENQIMSQLDDLNTAIQNEDVDVQAIAAVALKIDTDIKALQAAVAAGGKPQDLSTQIAAIQSHTASLATALGILQADDASASAPVPVISSPLTLSAPLAGPAVSYQIAASGSPTLFGATGLPAGLSIDTAKGLITGTPTAAGTTSVTISATNANGTGTATLKVTAA